MRSISIKDALFSASWGGFISAFMTFPIMLQEGYEVSSELALVSTLPGIISVLILSFLKGYFTKDENGINWTEVLFSLIGAILITASVGLGVFFRAVSA